MLRQGTRAQVMHGTALKTTGGLRRNHLKYNKQGKIVSRLLSTKAKKDKRLERAGWTVRKGEFGAVQMKGGFELGTISEKAKKYNSSITDKKKKIIPIPEDVCDNYLLSRYYTNINTSPYNYKCNWYGVRLILYKVADKLNIELEDSSKLSNTSARQLIMYLGYTPSKFIEFINTNPTISKMLDNVKEYTVLAEKNYNDNVHGMAITPENLGEQTLWKLAGSLNVNTRTPSPGRPNNVDPFKSASPIPNAKAKAKAKANAKAKAKANASPPWKLVERKRGKKK